MKRWASGIIIVAFFAACNSTGSHPSKDSNTSSPTAPSAAFMTTLAVTVTSATPSVVQLMASARFSDGTSRDVTQSAQWTSSNPSVALVSNGLVRLFTTGDAEMRASYWGVTGAMPLHVAVAPPRVTLQGIVWEVPPTQRRLGGARVEIMAGPDTGKFVLADSTGAYKFVDLSPSVLILKTTLTGYQQWEVGFTLVADRQEDGWLTPTPPKDETGASATARCKDGTWSWSQDAKAACTANGGTAYVVCPGPLCVPPCSLCAGRGSTLGT